METHYFRALLTKYKRFYQNSYNENHLRPLVDWRNAPTYKLIKCLIQILSQLISIPNAFDIKNSLELIQKLKEISINTNTRLVFLDIINMYANIPTQEFKIIIDNIPEISLTSKEIREEILSLYNIIIRHKYIYHNGKIYKQEEGLAVGPSSPAMYFEIFLQYVEFKKILINQ
jgi:hypothetical protein